jgi:hypothetical protein
MAVVKTSGLDLIFESVVNLKYQGQDRALNFQFHLHCMTPQVQKQ